MKWRSKYRITSESLKYSLKLPEMVGDIYNVTFDPEREIVEIYVASPFLPRVPEGGVTPCIVKSGIEYFVDGKWVGAE